MARPRKRGIEYFPFDVDFFSDKKIRILKSRFGADGITIYIYILCEVYRNGYYVQMDDDYEYIISGDLGMSNEKVKQVLKFLLERSLLNSKLFQSDTIITSLGIQRRFQEAVKSRALKSKIEVDERFWLLSEEETQPFIKCINNSDNSENNGGFSKNNSDNSENNDTKKSKVKESKEKIIESKDSIRQTEVRRAVEEWNRIGVNPVKKIAPGSTRYKMLSARIAEYGIQDVLLAISKVKNSTFLRGGGRKGWMIDLEWFSRPNNFPKVLEGKYDDQKPLNEREGTHMKRKDLDRFYVLEKKIREDLERNGVINGQELDLSNATEEQIKYLQDCGVL